LQQTTEYISQLLQEKQKILGYNSQLKRMIAAEPGSSGASTYPSPQSPRTDPPVVVTAKRRKTMDGALESADEGIGSMSPEHVSHNSDEVAELRREIMELRLTLDQERRHRISLEEHISILQQQKHIYPIKIESERYAKSVKRKLCFQIFLLRILQILCTNACVCTLVVARYTSQF